MRRGTAGLRHGGAWAGVAIVIGLVVLVGLLATVPYLIAADDAQRPPAEPQLTALELPPGVTLQSLEQGEVFEVLDGDTIDVRLADDRIYRVRYFGIDAPERGNSCYREAVDRNEQLLEDEDVYLLEDERPEDDFGRRLRYAFLEDGTSVDATLVAEGFAEAWREDGRYRDEIAALEEEAQAAGRGCLW